MEGNYISIFVLGGNGWRWRVIMSNLLYVWVIDHNGGECVFIFVLRRDRWDQRAGC